MLAYLMDWLELVVRWIHVITGVSWIGASFYFNWLNNSLRPPETPSEGVDGEVWAVHGGHFYRVNKYAVAPPKMPKTLHWFKYEAYFTWISGFGLLGIVYYYGAKLYLIDPSVMPLEPWQAIGIGIGVLLVGWLVYDLMCKSPLSRKPVLFSVLGFGLLTAVAYGLCLVFSSRGAYLHMGALVGTMMAANVFFVIIPNQKIMVAQMTAGETPDPSLGQAGALRSLHNNYFTLPVLFIMISHHYPMTFGHEQPWLVLAALAFIGAGVRHWFNLKGKGHRNVWILPAASVAMIALALVTAPRAKLSIAPDTAVTFEEARAIVEVRCAPCHAAKPTYPGMVEAPNGVLFDTPERIVSQATVIRAQSVDTHIMPLANLTGMTLEERGIVGAWIEQGAKPE